MLSHQVVSDSLRPHGLQHTRLPCPPLSPSFLKFTSIESVMLSNHLILCCPLLLPSIFPSIRVFSNELALPIRWPKYWSFTFSINLSNEYSWLISFRSDWFDLLAVQGSHYNIMGTLQCPQEKRIPKRRVDGAQFLFSSVFLALLRYN